MCESRSFPPLLSPPSSLFFLPPPPPTPVKHRLLCYMGGFVRWFLNMCFDDCWSCFWPCVNICGDDLYIMFLRFWLCMFGHDRWPCFWWLLTKLFMIVDYVFDDCWQCVLTIVDHVFWRLLTMFLTMVDHVCWRCLIVFSNDFWQCRSTMIVDHLLRLGWQWF